MRERTAMALHAKNGIRHDIYDDVYGSADISVVSTNRR